jgi:hypothetical protein
MKQDELRNLAASMHGLENLDDVYTFYYDETNNIRALKVTENGLNTNQLKCFVLGGILRKTGMDNDIEFNKLHTMLRLQKSTKEIKFCHLAKGNFLEILKSEKIGIFLEWLATNNLLIHYFAVDLLYYSVVDIIDTIIEAAFPELFVYHHEYKADLYKILRKDLKMTLIIFKRYSYPRLSREDFINFATELQDLLEYHRSSIEHFNFYMLKGLLQGARKVKSVPCFEGEEPDTLIGNLSGFYWFKIQQFTNSSHIFDRENNIEKIFSEAERKKSNIIKNYQFVDSKDEICIQISDVIIGILGKFFTFLNLTKIQNISISIDGLSLVQQKNLSSLRDLIDSSIDQNTAFVVRFLSAEDELKAKLMLAK